jgi:hypothetical protein
LITGNCLCDNLSFKARTAGRRYQGDRIGVGSQAGFSSYNSVKNRVGRRYPVGGRVRVYYDPRDSAQAVLERNNPLSVFYLASAGFLAVLLVGLYILFEVVGI